MLIVAIFNFYIYQRYGLSYLFQFPATVYVINVKDNPVKNKSGATQARTFVLQR